MSRDFIIYPALIGMLAISIPLFRSDEATNDSQSTETTRVAAKVSEVNNTVAEKTVAEKTAAKKTLEQVVLPQQETTLQETTLVSIPTNRTSAPMAEPAVEMISRQQVGNPSSTSTLYQRLCAAVRSQNEILDEVPELPTDLDEAGDHGHEHDDHGDHNHGDHNHGDHNHGDDHGDHVDNHGDHDHADDGDHNHAHSHSHDHSHEGHIYGDSVMSPMDYAPMESAQMGYAPMDYAPMAPVDYAPAVESFGYEMASPMACAAPVETFQLEPITIAPVSYAPVSYAPMFVQQYTPVVVQSFVVNTGYQRYSRKKCCLLSGLHQHLRNLFARHRAAKRARWHGTGHCN